MVLKGVKAGHLQAAIVDSKGNLLKTGKSSQRRVCVIARGIEDGSLQSAVPMIPAPVRGDNVLELIYRQDTFSGRFRQIRSQTPEIDAVPVAVVFGDPRPDLRISVLK